jgi:nickel-dependent lactate racemase
VTTPVRSRVCRCRARCSTSPRRCGTDDITVLLATGTHRASTPDELRTTFGDELIDRLRIENHECVASEHVGIGRVAGLYGGDVDVAVDRPWVDADIRLTTGFVEPHSPGSTAGRRW